MTPVPLSILQCLQCYLVRTISGRSVSDNSVIVNIAVSSLQCQLCYPVSTIGRYRENNTNVSYIHIMVLQLQ